MYKPELVKLNKFNIKGVHNKDSVSFHYDLSGLLSSYRIVNTSDSIIKSGKLLTSCCDITRFDTIANRDGSISVRISTMDKNGRILNTSFVELLKDKVTSVNTLKREFDESSKLLSGIYQFGIDYEQNGYFSECKYDQFNCLNSVEVTNNYNKEVFDLTYFHFNFKNPNDFIINVRNKDSSKIYSIFYIDSFLVMILGKNGEKANFKYDKNKLVNVTSSLDFSQDILGIILNNILIQNIELLPERYTKTIKYKKGKTIETIVYERDKIVYCTTIAKNGLILEKDGFKYTYY